MPATAAAEDILKELIEREDEAFLEYGKVAKEAAKSNIKWFLSSFADARQRIRDKLTKILERKVDDEFGYPEEEILHIHATEHLSEIEDVDEDSLQNVLLYISKKEQADLDYFRESLKEIKSEQLRKILDTVLKEKETIHTKADRLYHDMVETY